MRVFTTTVALGLCLVTAGAVAQELEEYSEVDGWAVMVDPTLGNGCLIQAEFEDGSAVRIGINATDGDGYVAAFNEGWGHIEDGAAYPVSFLLDEEPYEGEANGTHLGELPGVVIPFDSAEFLTDLAQRNTLSLSSGDTEVMVIDLSGTDTAIVEVLACQDAQG